MTFCVQSSQDFLVQVIYFSPKKVERGYEEKACSQYFSGHSQSLLFTEVQYVQSSKWSRLLPWCNSESTKQEVIAFCFSCCICRQHMQTTPRSLGTQKGRSCAQLWNLQREGTEWTKWDHAASEIESLQLFTGRKNWSDKILGTILFIFHTT